MAAARKRRAQRAQIIEQPSVRTYQQWTPRLVRSAEISADAGNMRLVAQLVEWLLGDDKIRGALDGRIKGLLGLPISFEASAGPRQKERDVRAEEADEDWWEIFTEAELFQVSAWGILLGFAPVTLTPWVERPDHDERIIPAPRFWHPIGMHWDWQAREWRARGDRGEPLEFAAGDGTWALYQPYGPYRPWSLGLWRSLSRWALLKAFAVQDFGRLGESATRNVITEAQGNETTEEARTQLVNDIVAMARESAIALPAGFDYKLIETAASTHEIYNKQIALADTAIAIAIRGNNLTTEVEGGSLAAATAHGKVDQAYLRSDSQTLGTWARDEILTWWAEFNFGDSGLAPWPKWQTDPPEDRKAKAAVMVQVAESLETFERLGFGVDDTVLAEQFGLDWLKPRPKRKPVQAPPQAPGTTRQPTPPQPVDDDESDTAQAMAALTRLASGFDITNASGFVEGQTYADALADRGQQRAAESLQPFLRQVLDLVDGVEDYAAAREKLIDMYADAMPPEELAERTEKLFILSQLAGMLAVNQDAPETRED